ncbi:MAG: hypothetical protein PVI54_19955, partial [Desulfobacteraceae bacterium]
MPSGDNSPRVDGRRPILTGSNLKRATRGRLQVALLVETELQKIAKKSEYWYGSGTWSSVHINQENLMEEVAFP